MFCTLWDSVTHLKLHSKGTKFTFEITFKRNKIQNNVITPDFDNNSILCDLTGND